MHLAVSPEHLAGISADLDIEMEGTAPVIANAPLAVPLPASAVSVSRPSICVMKQAVAWGRAHVLTRPRSLPGAEVLVLVGTSYNDTDTSGSSLVGRCGGAFGN